MRGRSLLSFVEGDRFLVELEMKEGDRFSDLWKAIAFG